MVPVAECDGIGEQDVDLKSSHSNDTGQDALNQPANGFVFPGMNPPKTESFLEEKWALKAGLCHSGHQDAYRKPVDLINQFRAKPRGDPKYRGDHDEVHGGSAQCGNEKIPPGIERSH